MDSKFSTRGFWEPLISNSSTEFRNSEWRIQYGGGTCKKLLDWDDIYYSGVFGVADYESELKFRNLEWRIHYGRRKCTKLFDRDGI